MPVRREEQLKIYLGKQHEFLKIIAAGIIAETYSDARNFALEKKIVGMPGEPPVDVYAEIGIDVPIIAEVKDYSPSMNEIANFLYYKCNEIKPYDAFFLAYNLGEPERAVLKEKTFKTRTKAGREGGRIKYEPPHMLIDL